MYGEEPGRVDSRLRLQVRDDAPSQAHFTI
jgi:hypothetical protein